MLWRDSIKVSLKQIALELTLGKMTLKDLGVNH